MSRKGAAGLANQEEDNSADLILLVSSRTPPYWRDIPEILARGKGTGFHFRYRKKWVPTRIFEDPNQVNGKLACIVHLDGPKEAPEYVPIRYAQMLTARKLGEHLRIEFTLGDLVRYEEAQQRDADPNPYSSQIEDALEEASLEAGYDGDFILPVRLKLFPRANDDESWTRIASQLVRFDTFNSENPEDYPPTIFLRITVRQSGGLLGATTAISRDTSGFCLVPNDEWGRPRLRAGKWYSLHMLQYVPSTDSTGTEHKVDAEKFPVTVSLETDEKVIRPIVRETTIRGKYDDSFLAFETKPRPVPTRSFIRLQADSDDEYFNVPTLRFDDVVILRSFGLWFYALAVLALFMLAWLLPLLIGDFQYRGVSVLPILSGLFQSVAALLLVFLAARIRPAA